MAPRSTAHLRRSGAVLAAFAALSVAGAARAATIPDAADDFLAAYTGPHVGYEDILSVSARREGGNLVLDATLAGDIDATAQANALYVWGVDRGQGAQIFPFGPGILFDSVIILNPSDLSARVARIVDGLPPVVHNGAVSLSGATISTVIPLADLPSLGFGVGQYRFSFWPRYINTAQPVSDFAPNATTFAIPEPTTWGLLIMGLGLARAALRRQKSAVRARLTLR